MAQPLTTAVGARVWVVVVAAFLWTAPLDWTSGVVSLSRTAEVAPRPLTAEVAARQRMFPVPPWPALVGRPSPVVHTWVGAVAVAVVTSGGAVRADGGSGASSASSAPHPRSPY